MDALKITEFWNGYLKKSQNSGMYALKKTEFWNGYFKENRIVEWMP